MRSNRKSGTPGGPLEGLESRQLLAGITINGTGNADTIYLTVDSGNLVVTNNNVVTTYPLASVTGVTINGKSGNDDLEVSYQFSAPCTILGNAGDDIIFGGSGPDVIAGGDGMDVVHGKNGNDILYANAGDTSGVPYPKFNYLYGENGNDTLYGGDDPDKIYGGTGSDLLYSGARYCDMYQNDYTNAEDGAVDYFYISDALDVGNEFYTPLDSFDNKY